MDLTRDQINEMSLDALNLAITEVMEPKPGAITARALREQERMTEWYSTHDAYSPGNWWRAEIGTDHNYDASRTFRLERDDAPVIWRPARRPVEDIADAWDVFIRGVITFGTASIDADMEHYGRGAILGSGPEEVVHVTIGDAIVADKAPAAICRAMLLAMINDAPQGGAP